MSLLRARAATPLSPAPWPCALPRDAEALSTIDELHIAGLGTRLGPQGGAGCALPGERGGGRKSIDMFNTLVLGFTRMYVGALSSHSGFEFQT